MKKNYQPSSAKPAQQPVKAKAPAHKLALAQKQLRLLQALSSSAQRGA